MADKSVNESKTKAELIALLEEKERENERLLKNADVLHSNQKVLEEALQKYHAKVDRMRKAHQNLLDITTNADW